MSVKGPEHVAIILDGNGRWATAQGLARTDGHEQGAKQIKTIALAASKMGIKYLTIYCFSTENWNRSVGEVNYLMNMPQRLLQNKQINDFNNEQIRINHIGRTTKMPPKTLEILQDSLAKTKDNKGMVLTFAFDYGAVEEMVSAINNIIAEKIPVVDETILANHLYTKDLPLVDLLIRPGGEKRLSNFLLFQSRYAELYFSDKYWPEFDEKCLLAAIMDYNNRNRRFGGITDNE
ncbi:undecaprenyl pyrophosphate synthase [Spiroplasma syrphidicola EA-1]|uniref:Isoprenyl transferase n=1 Tax=Spiroplasma syrphidicola EA-1 TaxID=1276229 RepID=R4UDE2_9MOLU|nr:polyprenyl diphosphate synthase [Spiroplasma syrphidicola]AGM25934.1 undecaprenyl pyrophosphate synthase [Spiroplasma syrphidicola EA-1]